MNTNKSRRRGGHASVRRACRRGSGARDLVGRGGRRGSGINSALQSRCRRAGMGVRSKFVTSNDPAFLRSRPRKGEAPLSTPFHKYDHVCCVDLRFWRGATREHPPQWGCDRGATKPEPKSDVTLRAAVLFGPHVVARSLETPEGYAPVPVRKHLAPRSGQKSLAANVVEFMKWGTKGRNVSAPPGARDR